MAIKLNKTIRDEIIEDAVIAAFSDRKALLAQMRTKFADELYERTFGEHELIALKLPDGWCAKYNSLSIKCDNFASYYRYDEDEELPLRKFDLSITRLFPDRVGDSLTIETNHPFYVKAQKIVAEHKAIHNDVVEFSNTLKRLLYSVTTVEKLREVWPEGEPFFPAEAQAVKLPIPFGLTESINKTLGFVKK